MKIPLIHLTVTISLGILFMSCSTGSPYVTTEHESPPPPGNAPEQLIVKAAEVLKVSGPTSEVTTTSCTSETKKQVTIVGQDPAGDGEYAFKPTNLNFSKGECVEFTLTAQSEFHTFTIEELEIDQSVDAGESVKFAFTFTTTGEFSLICIPHKDQGMVGTVTIQ